MSGAPICSGTMKFAKPYAAAGANRNIMIVPCMVNSWLYCSGLTTCSPGCASSARMIIAIAPAAMKNQNDVKM
jgi:hypothetical protein